MQQNPPGEDLRPWFLTLHDLTPPLDWSTFFPADGAVELDVGCGRGKFLVETTEARPDVNVCGVEIDYREGRRGAKRLKKRQSPNGRVVGGDARLFLGEFVPPRSVDVVHVYYPDPWWKRRHRHRRLFNGDFLDLVAAVLVPGGGLLVRTDVGEYFDAMTSLTDRDPRFGRTDAGGAGDEPLTSFERKAITPGRADFKTDGRVHDAAWQLVAAPP